MLYDVEQVANKLNISKMTVYNKIKLKEHKDKVIKKSGKTYIDEVLLKLIKDSLKIKSGIESDNIEEQENDEISMDKDDLSTLNKDLFDTLIDQLKEKDIQIKELNNRLAAEQDLNKNAQILLKNQQDKPKEDILLLESHFKELDIKIIEVMEHKKEEYKKKNKTGFLNWFK
jgi:hypothetical protein